MCALYTIANAILKPGGPLKWKKRLVKNARLLLPLTEVMRIARFTHPLPNVPRLSLPRPRLRHDRRLALLSRSNLKPKSVYSLLRSVAGSYSSSSSSTNFPDCSPMESASVYANYLRSHLSVSQPKVLRSRARGYLCELRQATCPENSHSSYCSLFSPAEFLVAASNLFYSTATGSDKVFYPTLKHLPRSGMDICISSHFHSSLEFAFLSFHLEDIFYHSHQ